MEGQSGNPGGRPTGLAEVRDLARAQAPKAIARLTVLMHQAAAEMVRVAAARELLDRGYGKPAQAIELHNDQPPAVFVIGLTNPTRDPLARPTIDVIAQPDEAVLDFRGVLDRPTGNGHPNGHP